MIRLAKKSNYTSNNSPNKAESDRENRKKSEMSIHDFNDVNWVPMSRNQKTRRPINLNSKFFHLVGIQKGYPIIG